MTFPKLSTKPLTKVYQRLLFNQCYLCEIRNEGTLCHYCEALLSKNTFHCQRCCRSTPITIAECGECQRTPPAFDQVLAPLQYEGLCRTMISKAKFEQQPYLLRPLIDILARHVFATPLTTHHWAIVPTSNTSIKQRGFCQTTFIRQQLRAALPSAQSKVIQYIAIQRHVDGAAQHNLGRKERKKLNHKHFNIQSPVPEQVILIDDIITTGSTIHACSQALKRAGAKQVIVWALARTPEQTGDLLGF